MVERLTGYLPGAQPSWLVQQLSGWKRNIEHQELSFPINRLD
jgi:hypothetical protein